MSVEQNTFHKTNNPRTNHDHHPNPNRPLVSRLRLVHVWTGGEMKPPRKPKHKKGEAKGKYGQCAEDWRKPVCGETLKELEARLAEFDEKIKANTP